MATDSAAHAIRVCLLHLPPKFSTLPYPPVLPLSVCLLYLSAFTSICLKRATPSIMMMARPQADAAPGATARSSEDSTPGSPRLTSPSSPRSHWHSARGRSGLGGRGGREVAGEGGCVSFLGGTGWGPFGGVLCLGGGTRVLPLEREMEPRRWQAGGAMTT
eukprot:1758432-Rhodomonas_salina.1